jgi:CRISPR system Cascade subunit CasE
MFLSKLELNLRCPEVRRDLSDAYELHRTIMGAFPDGAEGPGRVLYRVEDVKGATVVILIQSDKEPDCKKMNIPEDYFTNHPGIKTFDPVFMDGQQLIFRLTANPTVKRDGKRWGLTSEDDQRRWMERKASTGGFSIVSLRTIPHRAAQGEKGDGKALKFASVTFEGVLRVIDPTKFRETLEDGIGSGKGFGFGLLSLAPAH